MIWRVKYQLSGVKNSRLWGGVFVLWLFLMLVTPRISHSLRHHHFADMRNFLGVPNTLNVITTFPFLIVGVMGFVLCLQGNFFAISIKGEIWGWTLFYAGTAAVAFGSAYYHLKPDDNRLMWDTLPMMIAYSSLLSSLVVERVGERIGLIFLSSLILLSFISIACERNFDDLRLCMMFQLIPFGAIPCLTFLYPPKYNCSKYWHWATGFYFLGKFDEVADWKIYKVNHYIISGHSLEHLCLVMVPVLLTLMLMFRNNKIPRLGELKERP